MICIENNEGPKAAAELNEKYEALINLTERLFLTVDGEHPGLELEFMELTGKMPNDI